MADNHTDGREDTTASPTGWDVESERVDAVTEATPAPDEARARPEESVAEETVAAEDVTEETVAAEDVTEAVSFVSSDAPAEATDATDAPAVPAEPAASVTSAEVDAERERLAAERAARREARLAALAPTPAPVPEPVAEQTVVAPTIGAAAYTPLPVTVETVEVTHRNTDRFAGSLGLFLLRLVTAAIMGLYGLTHLLNLTTTTELIGSTVLPEPGILAIVLGAGELAIAIGLVFGLLTRVAGLGVVLVAGGALGFVLWGPWSPFTAGQAGFTGQFEVLLVAVGVLFLLVGGGGWSVDRGFRARRAEARNR